MNNSILQALWHLDRPTHYAHTAHKNWHHTLEVVQRGCNQQALHIRPLCFEKHQPLFFFFLTLPAAQQSAAMC